MTKKYYLLLPMMIVVVIFMFALPYILGGFLLGGTSLELITQSVSPSGEYTVYAYRVNAGATVDYSLEAYLMNNDKKEKKIYNAYHEREAEINWIDNHNVCINGKTLNLSNGETYDWRKGKGQSEKTRDGSVS